MIHRPGLGQVCILAVLATLSLASPAFSATIYVKADATGANDATSWADATHDLQSALSVAASGDQIWGAAGTYKPSVMTNPPESRLATFQLLDGVAIYGGSAGAAETQPSQRSPAANITILDGCSATGIPSEHVVTASGTGSSAILDSCTIPGRFSNPPKRLRSSGIYLINASPTIVRCRISSNYGRDPVNNSGGSPRIVNCMFSLTESVDLEAAPLNDERGSPSLTNCVFFGDCRQSGDLNTVSGSSVLTICTFGQSSCGAPAGFQFANAAAIDH